MPNYTTQAIVRQRAGFAGNLSITTESITTAIATADAIIDSALYGIYSLPMSETPSIIKEVATHLSVGQILIDNYGIQDEDQKKNGEQHITFAQSLLADIRGRKLAVLDSASKEMTTVETSSPSFYPNDTSASSTTDSTSPAVWMNQDF